MKNLIPILIAILWYPLVILSLPIIVLVFLIFSLVNHKAILKSISINKKYLRYFIIFLISGSISFTYNLIDKGLINFKAEFFILWMNIVIPFLVFYCALLTKEHSRLIGSFFVLFILLSSFSVVVSQVGLNFFDFDRELRLNLFLVRNDIAPTTYSLLLSAAIFIVIYVLDYNVIYTWISLGLLLFFQFLLATRFAIAGSLFLVFLHLIRGISIKNIISFISGIGILIFVTFSLLHNNDRLNHRLSLALSVEDVLRDESLVTRLYLWNEAIQIAQKSPLGNGYMYFVSRYGKIGEFGVEKGWNTHNEFLLQLVGAGWIHFIILLWGLFFLLKTVWRYSRKVSIALIILLFCSWFFDTASNNPGSINSFYIYYMCIALILCKHDSKIIEKY